MRLDVNHLIDEGRWTTFQKFLIACTALTIILDGIDNQLLATAIPDLMKEWNLQRGDFSMALAMSPVGMLAGGLLGGWLGDRIGRRMALLMSVLLFAFPTALIYFAHNVTELSAFRFLAGVGLGGAMPSATALASEYVPRRQRPFAVTLTIVCVPVGATLAAELSAHVIPLFGWRNFFLVGGTIPFVLGAILFFLLPESPRYLAGRPARWGELRKMLRRMQLDVPADATFGEPEPAAAASGSAGTLEYATPPRSPRRGSIVDLFAPGLIRDTLSLFGCFFFCLLTVYLSLQLLVTALTTAGFSPFDARRTLFWWNIGGVVGAILGALVIQRLGSRVTMTALCVVAVASCLGLASLPLSAQRPAPAATGMAPATIAAATPESGAAPAAATKPAPPKPLHTLDSPVGLGLILLCVLMGAAINAVQVAMYALAAHIYPTAVRSTGLGFTVAVGRVGNVLASYVGNFALDHGIAYFFAASGVGMLCVMVALLVVRSHIERQSQQGIPLPLGAATGE